MSEPLSECTCRPGGPDDIRHDKGCPCRVGSSRSPFEMPKISGGYPLDRDELTAIRQAMISRTPWYAWYLLLLRHPIRETHWWLRYGRRSWR